jgi:hypothetical protein
MNNLGTVYHLGTNGVQSGPFSEQELLARIARGELTGAELCWTESWKDWKPLNLAFPGAAFSAPLPLPPAIPGRLSPPPAVSIEGKSLVVPKNAPFPPICVRTGVTEDLIARPLRVSLSWHQPAVYFAILANILIYVIFALIFRKTSVHAIYLSRTARAAQVKWHLANWGIFLGSWLLFGAAVAQESGVIGLTAAAAFVASIIIYFTKVRLLHATKVDADDAYIGGIAPDVMAKIVAAWK